MNAPASEASTSAWSVLRHPGFRWFFFAQIFSVTGSAMQLAAVNWDVWRITHNELALGVVGLVRIVPIIVLSLLGGVVADAIDRRRLQLATQTLMLIFAGLLAFVTITGNESLALIYILTAAISGMAAFDQPARNAMIPNLVEPHEISHAARLNVVMYTVTSVLGPVITGFILAKMGSGAAYLFNALSFLPVVIVLIGLKRVLMSAPVGVKREISLNAMFEGLRFVRSSPLLWSTMLVDFFATLLASATVLLPVYATDVLKVGAIGYGALNAAPAIGATIGAIVMAQYGGRIQKQGVVMLWAVAWFGVATIVFGYSTVLWLSLLALAGTGFTDSISAGIRSPLRQVLTPDHLRGRMLSVNMMFFMGGPQLGEFEAGVMARAFGPVVSVVTGGIATVLCVAWIAYSFPTLTRYRTGMELAEADAPEGVPVSS
ncbi:MAG: MFS transporter [Anaerolineaceae bacterium]|nr:MFS transporter [Anaerolineaceae bacterium]